MARLLTGVVGVLAVLAFAACGGDSNEDEYKDGFPPISKKIVSLGEQVGDSIQNAGRSSDEDLADDFGNYADEVGDVQQELEELEPPEDLAEDQDQLVSALGEIQGSLTDISKAAEQNDPSAARDATAQLIQSSEQVRDARQRLAEAVRDL